jgi:hypothetical protein
MLALAQYLGDLPSRVFAKGGSSFNELLLQLEQIPGVYKDIPGVTLKDHENQFDFLANLPLR